MIGPNINQTHIANHLYQSSKLINHIESSVLPKPPLKDLLNMLSQLNYLQIGHNHSLSLANARKLTTHIAQLKNLIGDAQYKDYLQKIEEINGLKQVFSDSYGKIDGGKTKEMANSILMME